MRGNHRQEPGRRQDAPIARPGTTAIPAPGSGGAAVSDRSTVLDEAFREMRDNGASAAESAAQLDAHDLSEHLEAIEASLAFRSSLEMAEGTAARRAAMLAALANRQSRRRTPTWLASPVRGLAAASAAFALVGAAAVAAANPGGARESVQEALGLVAAPQGECAAPADGEHLLCAWGANDSGQLGPGSPGEASTRPFASGENVVVSVAAGQSHTLAILADGSVVAWGDNSHGQLGDGRSSGSRGEDGASRSDFVTVDLSGLPAGATVRQVSAGDGFSLALLSDGTVLAWGRDDHGQLGDDASLLDRGEPVPVAGLEGIVEVAAGGSHSLAVADDGTLWAWGWNFWGQV
ncbi:MAG: hypothetical protein GEU28_11820, partial [Dehalococcoidia bacterium]|nr:hypothetical protein [Dehalococcoidia bacterium]